LPIFLGIIGFLLFVFSIFFVPPAMAAYAWNELATLLVPAAPTINYWQAFAAILVIGLFRPKLFSSSKEGFDDMIEKLTEAGYQNPTVIALWFASVGFWLGYLINWITVLIVQSQIT
jgi:hypothetical protein